MQQISTAQKQLIQIALVALLLVGCVAVLLPFTGTLLFACVICVTTAPFHRWILKCCHGRTSLAAVLMSCILLLLLVAPLALLSGSLADGIESAILYFRPLLESGLPDAPPLWLAKLPVVGPDVSDYWHRLAASR